MHVALVTAVIMKCSSGCKLMVPEKYGMNQCVQKSVPWRGYEDKT